VPTVTQAVCVSHTFAAGQPSNTYSHYYFYDSKQYKIRARFYSYIQNIIIYEQFHFPLQLIFK